jgi:hypothetical protein
MPRISKSTATGGFLPRGSGAHRLLTEIGLGVGFGPVTVNRDRLDLLVLDAALRVATRFERRLWHEEAVLAALRAAQRPRR